MGNESSRLGLDLNKRNIALVMFLTIIFLGSVLRFYCLGCKSLWYDEIVSIKRSEEYSITELTQMFRRRLPPLYDIVLRLFLYLGNNEFVGRLPSVIFGLLSITLVYKIGTLFFGRREGLISAFLLSISTMHIQYSQEARMYSLAMFLSLLSLYFFYKALKEGNIILLIGSVVSTLLGIFTHYYVVFIPLIEMPLFVFILFKNRGSLITRIQKVGRKKLFIQVLSFAIIIALVLPALQAASISILEAFETGIAFEVPWGIKPTRSFFLILFDRFNTGGFLSGALEIWREPIFYTFLLILLFGLFSSAREYRKPVTLLIFWVFLPTITVFILSLVLGKPIAHPRYMLFILPGYLVSISRGVSCMADHLSKRLRLFSIAPPKRNYVISLALAIGVFAGSAVLPLQKYYEWEKPNWRATGEYLEANASPGEIILVEPPYTLKCLLYYYDPDSEETYVTSFDDSMIDNLESIYGKAGCLHACNLFLVYSKWHSSRFDPEGENGDWLLHNNFIEAKRFTGISIYYRPESLISVFTGDMEFSGLDSPLGEPVAKFWHNNDSATFKLEIPKNANYTMAIHAKSSTKSAIEIIIDGVSQGTKVFFADDWSLTVLGTFYLAYGSHEVTIVNKEGKDLGDTNIIFDAVTLYPSS